LCRAHHRAVHEGGYSIQRLDDGAIRFLDPDGKPVDTTPGPRDPGDWRELARHDDVHGIRVDSDTSVSWWLGEPLDLNFVTDDLMRLGKRGPYRAEPTAHTTRNAA
jgi:hypothetical protein